MSKRPASVKVGPFDIEILSAPLAHDFGTFESSKLRITLDSQFPSSVLEAETLQHEILHAIWWSSGLHPKDDEERTVLTLSKGLMQVWRDNPELVLWMISALKGK